MIDIFDTGYFYADGGAMFGAVPKTAWSRRYESDGQNGCVLAMRSVLVENSGHLILIDAGAGNYHPSKMSYYRFFNLKSVEQCLEEKGYHPEDITDVILTHLHFDHCGGCAVSEDNGKFRMAFPNARHWVGRGQWDNFLKPHALEKDSFFIDDMKSVEDSGLLRLVESDENVIPGFSLKLADGHTHGQIIPYITINGETLVFAGDVIPLAASVSPEWISAYDIAPLRSYDSKIRLLDEAAENSQRIIFCHDAYTVSSKVRKTKSGLYLLDRGSLIASKPIPQILQED
ncbi:MAG: MBL fold metallo-hydrolase [Parabacteroides sp.]|nr:MBL fold metallo-hydrolase [Parabacteroides sp.]